MNDFPGARTAFRDALKLDPTDAKAAARVDLCERVLALDPTLRGLSAPERRRRAHVVLAAVTTFCPATTTSKSEDALAKAREIWDQCTTRPGPDDPLYLVMTKLQH